VGTVDGAAEGVVVGVEVGAAVGEVDGASESQKLKPAPQIVVPGTKFAQRPPCGFWQVPPVPAAQFAHRSMMPSVCGQFRRPDRHSLYAGNEKRNGDVSMTNYTHSATLSLTKTLRQRTDTIYTVHRSSTSIDLQQERPRRMDTLVHAYLAVTFAYPSQKPMPSRMHSPAPAEH
jgi:hypothetical protein